ncbi:MAG TPA: CcdB family protein [Phenylobacterium sp.]|uniref:CcdB family protein n=1 Tax=Phenylobacterium sp. TaxID=1871053 RepID=UPI002D5D1BCF|nr:CcdB family protein [Phenylobacterium sp.]HZZ68256.1 CcdB family protein [Phenylobacterium sp.]
MRQFDVVENPSASLRRYAPFLIILQSHLLDVLESVIVAPLVVDADRPLTVIDLAVRYADRDLILAISEMASIDRQRLGEAQGTLSEHEYDIRRALERVFTGF